MSSKKMKKYVVVVKEGFNPNSGKDFAMENQDNANQLSFTPLYENDVQNSSIAFSEKVLGDNEKRLNALVDEMKRTYTFVIDKRRANEFVRMLKGSNLIERIEEDSESYQCATSKDTFFDKLHGLKKIQVENVWDLGFKGQEVVVAVIDSGIDVGHPDLVDRLLKDDKGNIVGFNVIDQTTNLKDESNHGTHVAGIIAATCNNGIGVCGVAPECKIMPIKALSGPNGRGSNLDLASAIRLAVDKGAKVINNSWEPGRHTEIEKAIEYAFLRNVLVVFAAGNDNREVVSQDAAGNPLVISVAASDDKDERAGFTNFGSLVTVSAPGVNILSTSTLAKRYKSLTGTSMAAPHVAGLAALVLCKNNTLKPNEVKDLISQNCDTFNPLPTTPVGAGRVNAEKTVGAIP